MKCWSSCCERSSKVFLTPVSNQPEKIIITDDMRRSLKFAHAMYRECLEREKEEEEAQRRKQISEHAQKEREKLVEMKESLAKSEESLNEQEEKATQELSAADELLKDARLKLDSVLASKPISTNSMVAAKMMLETAEKKRKQAMEKLDEIRKKQKSLDKSTHKLLDQALSSKHYDKGRERLKVMKNLVRRRKVTKHCIQYSVTCYRCGT